MEAGNIQLPLSTVGLREQNLTNKANKPNKAYVSSNTNLLP